MALNCFYSVIFSKILKRGLYWNPKIAAGFFHKPQRTFRGTKKQTWLIVTELITPMCRHEKIIQPVSNPSKSLRPLL